MVRKKNDYYDTLRAFLGYIDGVKYGRGHVFSNERLSRVVPEEIVQFFNFKAYGDPNPSSDARPTHGRSSALYYYKKAISQCLPNKHIPWNDLAFPTVKYALDYYQKTKNSVSFLPEERCIDKWTPDGQNPDDVDF